MQKLILLMLAWFLLGQMPLKQWNEIKDVNAFMKSVAEAFAVTNQCPSTVIAVEKDGIVFIIGQCHEEKKVPEVDPDKIVGRR